MIPKYSVARILSSHWATVLSSDRFNSHQIRHLSAIKNCRTAAMGGHLYKCDSCEQLHRRYNSCRNRHCPNCQNTQQLEWIQARTAEVLPTTYYHVVFTIPDTLNELCLAYPRQLYTMLFHTAWETLETLGWDHKYLGAQIGATMVLHTWGQNMSLHPHVHCIVPGGGVDYRGKWRNAKGNGKFLFPVRVMSSIFRGKFVRQLKLLFKLQGMDFTSEFNDKIYAKNWVAYCKTPFGQSSGVIEYLARYTHKIAISNYRIVDAQKQQVTFKYKDYRQAAKVKLLTLSTHEFIRRFSLHILPSRFIRIRHYGILSSKLKFSLFPQLVMVEKKAWDILWAEQNLNVYACTLCKKGILKLICEIPKRGPPALSRPHKINTI